MVVMARKSRLCGSGHAHNSGREITSIMLRNILPSASIESAKMRNGTGQRENWKSMVSFIVALMADRDAGQHCHLPLVLW